MWYVMNHSTGNFATFAFPELVMRHVRELVADGLNKDELEIIHAADDERLSVEEFHQKWDSDEDELHPYACDSETCLFNPKGICLSPRITGRVPAVHEDGCDDWREKGADHE